MMKTFVAKPSNITRESILVDAKNRPIGRVATRIATLLQGKHKTTYTPHEDTGDMVIVINAAQVASTGKKEKTKLYHRHSGYPGGIKSMTLETLRALHPERIIEFAVRRMLPKGPLGRKMFRKLRVYANDQHLHSAQEPKLDKI